MSSHSRGGILGGTSSEPRTLGDAQLGCPRERVEPAPSPPKGGLFFVSPEPGAARGCPRRLDRFAGLPTRSLS